MVGKPNIIIYVHQMLQTDRHWEQTFNLDSFLIGARIARTGHDHGDCRAVLVPHGGAGGQFTVQGVLDDFI